jgi:hypothetical protein
VNQRREKQGKTEAIGRAHATMGEFSGQIGRQSHRRKTNIAFFWARHDNAMLVFSCKRRASSDKLHRGSFKLQASSFKLTRAGFKLVACGSKLAAAFR